VYKFLISLVVVKVFFGHKLFTVFCREFTATVAELINVLYESLSNIPDVLQNSVFGTLDA